VSAEVDEVWRPTFIDPNYEVSNLGRVRSISRIIVRGDGTESRHRGRILRLPIGSSGYRQFGIKRTMHRVHVVVLTTFTGPPQGDMNECRHLNGDAMDNRLVNLAWGTHLENILDITRHGRNVLRNRVACPRGHRLVEPNLRASALRIGRRECRACHQAAAAVEVARHRGVTLEFVEVSHQKYAAIMQGMNCADDCDCEA
jgi:hypothetical protein